MSKKLKITLSIGFAVFFFLMGILAAHFQFFPYKQIVELRSSPLIYPLKNAVRQTAGPPGAVAASVKNTALQRLLIKEVPLEKYPVLSSTYIVEAGGVLHIVSTHGEFLSLDLSSFERVDSELTPVPMNLDQLIDSPLVGETGFTENHFRVLGVFAETAESGEEHIYATHHRYEEDGDCVTFTVSRIQLNDGSVTSVWETLFTGTPCMRTMIGSEGESQRFHIRQTSGGAMTPFGEDDLLFSVGDYGYNGMIHESMSDLPDSLFGKIYRLNKHTGEASVFAEGLRNTQGMYTDREGTVWATDHGPGGGDELNIIREGKHYGWPEVTYGIEYGNQPWPHNPEQGRHDGFENPEYVWMNAIAPTDILRIETPDFFKDWQGDLLIGSLLDRSLHRVRVADGRQVIYSERIEIGHRIRSMLLLSNGSIALMTDGRVLVIIGDGGPVYEPMDDEVRNG
jgi:aldose sugar dehydrogenase